MVTLDQLMEMHDSISTDRARLIGATLSNATEEQVAGVVRLLDIRTHQLTALNTLIVSMQGDEAPPFYEEIIEQPDKNAVRYETLQHLLMGDMYTLARDAHSMEGPDGTIVPSRVFIKKNQISVCVRDVYNPANTGNIFKHDEIGLETPVVILGTDYYPQSPVISMDIEGNQVVYIPESED